MDKFQAAFELLYILSAIDGSIDEQEIEVIKSFLESQYGKISFSAAVVAESISDLTGQGLLEELQTAAMVFKNASAATDRTILLQFAIELVAADGYVSAEEKQLLHDLAELFNINLDRLLARLQGAS